MCNKLIYFVFVLGLVLPGIANADAPVPNLLWWKFDTGSGATATDNSSSAQAHDGVITGATWVPGSWDGSYCLDFGGDGDFVEDADAESFLNGLSALTVAMWIKSDLIDTDRGFIIGLQPAGGDRSITMRYDSAGASGGGTNLLKMAVSSAGEPDGDGQQLESSNNSQTTEWQHVCMTWASATQIRFYIRAC